MRYYKFPKWIKRIYPKAIWDFFSTTKRTVYLTFDDGPTQSTTPWILATLAAYNAKATFFCVGRNAALNPVLIQQTLHEHHSIGNHTQNHLKGWKTSSTLFIQDVKKAEQFIASKLFRPPYGKMNPKQHRKLKALGFTTIFWSHISYDFDKTLPLETCLHNLKKAIKPGAIIVFHDSEKAFHRLQHLLPEILDYLKQENYTCNSIEL